MGFVDIITDPSVHFVGACFGIGYAYAQSKAEQVALLTNQYLLSILGFIIVFASITSYVAQKRNIKLSFAEKKLAQWYLMNGAFVHTLLDGLSSINAIPAIHTLYYKLDSRYRGDDTVDVLSYLELFVMAPLCLLQYYALRTKASYRHGLQIVISTLQLAGTAIYLGTEYMAKGSHMMIDWKLTFTKEFVTFFWFPIVFGCAVYIIVPIVLILLSIRSISLHYSVSDKNLIPVSNDHFVINASVFTDKPNPYSPLKTNERASITPSFNPRNLEFDDVSEKTIVKTVITNTEDDNGASTEIITTTTTTTTTTVDETIEEPTSTVVEDAVEEVEPVVIEEVTPVNRRVTRSRSSRRVTAN